MTKILNGVVVSDKADKTVVVKVMSSMTHPIYRKKYTISKKFLVHDEKNEAHVGDQVRVVETRPISARKHFKLERIVEKAVMSQDDKEIDV
jgi:small subunit ribosomal protein S17